MKTIHSLIPVLLLLACILMPVILHAQPGFGTDVNDSGAPLDGGLSVLAIAGAGYGLKKIKEARKKKNEQKADDAIEK